MQLLFLDPIYRASFLGSCLICFCAGIMGVFLLLQKRALLSETLAHAAYPGMALGGIFSSLSGYDLWLCFFFSALFFCIISIYCLHYLEKNNLAQDTAMGVTISGFFGLGILFTSYLQNHNAALFLEMQKCFFGEVATMLDEHLVAYFALTVCIITFCTLFYRRIQLHLFDPKYAQSAHLYSPTLDFFIGFFLVLSIVMSIRSCGIILISAMLIAPVVAARIFVRCLSSLFFLSALFGLIAGVIGNILSIYYTVTLGTAQTTLPPGPLIVLVSAFIVVLSHLFAPKGLIAKGLRCVCFRGKTAKENVLKALFKENICSVKDIEQQVAFPKFFLGIFLQYLRKQGLIQKKKQQVSLTKEGKRQACRIVRLHRLWEVYLTKHMHVCAKKVHLSAEEMEHILTPDLEKRLDQLLQHPRFDPHDKPIPKRCL